MNFSVVLILFQFCMQFRFAIGLWPLWTLEPWNQNISRWQNPPSMSWLELITIMELEWLIHLSKNGIGIPTKTQMKC